MTNSRTIWFMTIMAGLESLNAGLHYLNGMISESTYEIVSLVLGVSTAMGGIYLRTITTKPLSER